MEIERRKFKRLKVNFTLIYRVDKPLTVRITIGWNKEIEALMLDLSEGGMCILTDYDIPVFTALMINFTLINFSLNGNERTRKMQIAGQVRYNNHMVNNEHRLGISFSEISEESRKAIADFVTLTTHKKF